MCSAPPPKRVTNRRQPRRPRSTDGSRDRGEALGEALILSAEPVDLGSVDGDDLAARQRADASRTRPILGQERPFADHRAWTELATPFGRLHHDVPLDHHVEAGARFAALDQHLPGTEHELRAHRLKLPKIVLVHDAEYRIPGGDDPVTGLEPLTCAG